MKEFKFKIGGQDYTATVEEEKQAGALKVTVNGKTYQVEIPLHKATGPRPVASNAAPAAPVAGPVLVSSELPGTIIKLNVAASQHVKRGDVLMVIESMKMANDIVAECDGTIQKVVVSEGQNVNQGDLMIEMVADYVAAEAPALTPKPAPAPPQPVAAPVQAPKVPVGSKDVVAPLPGTITKILVQDGQAVKAGDTLLMLEAMKMENSITAEADGTVKKIVVQQGAQVQGGEILVEME